MVEIVYSPQWFYGKDIVIDLVSVVVLLLIAFFALKYYSIEKKNKNYRQLAISFFLLALAFAMKILTYFTIYYKAIETKSIGAFTLTFEAVKSSYLLIFVGEFFYHLITLIGLLMLYSIYKKKQCWSTMFIVVYLLFVITLFEQNIYYIFHLTCLILLVFITHQYYTNHVKNKKLPSMLLFYSFMIITLSQVLFIFIQVWDDLYAIAEIVQLVGYILLAVTFIMVLFYGKKTRQA